jgi:hypothetical protein
MVWGKTEACVGSTLNRERAHAAAQAVLVIDAAGMTDSVLLIFTASPPPKLLLWRSPKTSYLLLQTFLLLKFVSVFEKGELLRGYMSGESEIVKVVWDS